MVEQFTVNELVGGSNPSAGAKVFLPYHGIIIPMRKLLLSIFTFSLFLTLASQPVLAAKNLPTLVGNDISYPQCNKTYPKGQAFGIVGVNGGLANTTNLCLGSQLLWSQNSLGGTNQIKAQLYVNTANPGGLNTPSWPQNNIDPSGNVTSNPYVTCDGSDSLACAWQYGWNRAVEDVQYRFLPTAQSAGVNVNTASYPWWLDVETVNTWKSGSTFSLQSNTADLEGMVAYFQSIGAPIGLYSTSNQWGQIVGSTVSASSNLNGLNNWLPGARSLSSAKSNCSLSPLTAGGKAILTQYVSGQYDYDYSCI